MPKNLTEASQILIIGYNRPELILKRLVNATSLRDRKISLYLDYNDEETLSQMRFVISQFKDKIRETNDFTVVMQKENLGLAKNVTTSISTVLSKTEKIIVIEDDIEFNPHSIYSLDFGLDIMNKNPDLASVGMYSPFRMPQNFREKNFFRLSRYFSCWGWATTKEIWSKYELDISKVDINNKLENSQIFLSMNKNLRATWLGRFNKLKKMTFHTWDVQFQLLSFEQNLRHLIPFSTIANNEGFSDFRSTHTKGNQPCWMGNHHLPDSTIKKVIESKKAEHLLDLVASYTSVGDAHVNKNLVKIIKSFSLKRH